jgi:acyl-CoA synthetase (AMP-forming)/AMP-acid ligase II
VTPQPLAPAQLSPNVPTLGNVLTHAAEQHCDRVFLEAVDRTWTFAEVESESLKLAASLLAAGVGKGTRVAILMGNTPEWILAWLAAGRIGALTIPVSTLFQPPELAWLLKFADVDTILFQAEYAGHDYVRRLERAIPGLADAESPILAIPTHPFLRRAVVWTSADSSAPAWAYDGPDALAAQAGHAEARLAIARSAQTEVSPADLFVGICTSGTTSEPKLVIHTHGSVIRMTQNYSRFRPDITSSSRDLATMPFFWVGGLNGHLFLALYAGSCLVLPRSPRPEDLVAAAVRGSVTRLVLFPARMKAVVEAARAMGVDLSRIIGVKAPTLPNGEVVPLNLRGSNMLGMTETFGPHGFTPADVVLHSAKAGSAGRSLEGIHRRVVDPQTGAERATGDVGLLQLRGFSMMDGYYKRERGDVFTPDGWLETGDLCRFDDDGYVYFEGRSSDLIKTMAANVAPLEVEVALASHPSVREAIVFGLPHELRGEVVVAVVVPVTGAAITGSDLKEHLAAEISSYKVPSEIVFLDYEDIPRTDLGKPKKPLLKDIVRPVVRLDS